MALSSGQRTLIYAAAQESPPKGNHSNCAPRLLPIHLWSFYHRQRLKSGQYQIESDLAVTQKLGIPSALVMFPATVLE